MIPWRFSELLPLAGGTILSGVSIAALAMATFTNLFGGLTLLSYINKAQKGLEFPFPGLTKHTENFKLN